MRHELRTAVRGLLEHLTGQPYDKTVIRGAVIALASYVARARSPVDRDARHEIRLVLDAEAPTRIVKMLTQLWRAAGLLRLPQADAWAMVCRVGLDSVPKLRRIVLDHLAGTPAAVSTTVIADAVEHPTITTRRALEDLTAHRAVVRTPGGPGKADRWELTEQMRRWLDTFSGLSDSLVVPPETVSVSSGHTHTVPDSSSIALALLESKNVREDKTEKVGHEEMPAWVTDIDEPPAPGSSDAAFADHDEDEPATRVVKVVL